MQVNQKAKLIKSFSDVLQLEAEASYVYVN